jgi:membrane-associated phospholipid phosphatase
MMGNRRTLGACVAVLLVACSCRAEAEIPAWRDEWPRFRAWEYALTGGAAAIGVAARFVAPHPSPNWRGGILFDDATRDLIGARHEPTRVVFAIGTHVMGATAVAYRLVDSTIVPGEVHDDWDLAGQMLLIDAESYAVMVGIMFGAQVFVGRERPIVRRCAEPAVAKSDRACEPGDSQRNRSFIAGHTALGFTAAGLTCAHHANLPLYGGGSADHVACGVALGWASLLGIGRVVTDNHYATDTLLGALLGLGAGWLLPLALHYGFDANDETAETTQPLRPQRVLPLFSYGAAF